MIATLIFGATALLFALGCFDLVRRNWRQALLEIAIAAIAFAGARMVLGRFPMLTAFGDKSPVVVVVVLLVCSAIGAIAQEYWRDPQPSLHATLRAVLVTPITILPVYQVAQRADAGAETMIFLGLLAFQSGFFWRAVLENSRRSIARVGTRKGEPT